jgi:FkbM family methyltransferase
VHELSLVRRAFRNWPVVALASVLWKYLPLPAHEIRLDSRSGARFVAPLGRDAGAVYPALDIFAFSAYDCDWTLEEAPYVIDIGANIGAFTLWLAERYPDVRGSCYEPDPDAFTYLRRNVEGVDVVARSEAVADRSGTARLLRPSPSGGKSSLRTANGRGDENAVDVRVVSFDEVMAQVDEPVALVKMDCEGSEYDIVLESRPESWRFVRRVVIEYHPVEELGPTALVERLTAHGFVLVCERERVPGEGTYWFARSEAS